MLPEAPTMPADAPADDDGFVRRSLVATAAIGALSALVMGYRGGVAAAASTALGALVGATNFWALARLITKLIDRNADATRGRAAVLLVGKALALLAGSAWLISRPWMEFGGFLVGFTSMIAGITVGALWGGPSAPRDGGADQGER